MQLRKNRIERSTIASEALGTLLTKYPAWESPQVWELVGTDTTPWSRMVGEQALTTHLDDDAELESPAETYESYDLPSFGELVVECILAIPGVPDWVVSAVQNSVASGSSVRTLSDGQECTCQDNLESESAADTRYTLEASSGQVAR